ARSVLFSHLEQDDDDVEMNHMSAEDMDLELQRMTTHYDDNDPDSRLCLSTIGHRPAANTPGRTVLVADSDEET
ncbi:unnamed protein product, partial [Dicrocoelium dendriticum]